MRADAASLPSACSDAEAPHAASHSHRSCGGRAPSDSHTPGGIAREACGIVPDTGPGGVGLGLGPCPGLGLDSTAGVRKSGTASDSGQRAAGLRSRPHPGWPPGSATDVSASSTAPNESGLGLQPGPRAGGAPGAGFVPARTAEYLHAQFWQERFERGDAHEWFGSYASFRALLAPRLSPGAHIRDICSFTGLRRHRMLNRHPFNAL